MTWRAVLVSLCMVLSWTAGCLYAVAHWSIYSQHLLMILGFGAILTIFLLQAPRVFLGSVLLVWIGSTLLALRYASPEDYGRLLNGAAVSAIAAAPLCALAVWIGRRPLKRGELVIIYAAVAVAIPWSICLKAVIETSAANLIEVQRMGEPQMYAWAKEMPWWGPTVPTGPTAPPAAETLAAADGFARGNGGHVPWSLWWRPILYWSALCGCWAAMLTGILLMFRKRWIEHERLPFVWALPALILIQGRQQGPPDPDAPTREPISRNGWTMFLIGLGLCVPSIVFMSPTGLPMSTWSCPPWAGGGGILGGVDLTDLNLIPGIDLRLAWCPLILVAMLFFPLDVLLTVALSYILLKILLPGMLSSAGFTAGKTALDNFVRYGLEMGGAVGLLVWSVWFNRRTIWGYVRSLWGLAPANPESCDELGRRKVVTLALLGFAGFIVLGAYGVQPYGYTIRLGDGALVIPVPVQMLALTFLMLVFTIAQVRMRVEGQLTTYDNNYVSHQLVSLQRDFWHDHYTLASKGVPVTGTSWAAHWLQWGFCGQLKSYGPHNLLLEAFKIGHETGVHPRAVAKAVLASLLLVGVLTPVIYLQLIYGYGYENSYQGMLSSSFDYAQWSERACRYGTDSTSRFFWWQANTFYESYSTVFNIIYGVGLVGILFYLRREFPRFPISPVGVVIAGQAYGGRVGFSTDLVWFTFLLAGLAKALIFRWMGVRSFRERVQPALVLMLCGLIFGMMLYVFRHVVVGQGALK